MPRLPLQVEQNVSPGNQGRNQASSPDLTGMNELNITNYLVPTPESDWLAGGNTFWA
jgi:spore coat protein CotF